MSTEYKREFKSKAGVTNHQRTQHPTVFRAEHEVAERVKLRWTAEEKDMLALVEAKLLYKGIKPRLVKGELKCLFPQYSNEHLDQKT